MSPFFEKTFLSVAAGLILGLIWGVMFPSNKTFAKKLSRPVVVAIYSILRMILAGIFLYYFLIIKEANLIILFVSFVVTFWSILLAKRIICHGKF